jgi:hypothetical protein
MTTTEQNTSARAYVVGCNIAGYLPESSPYAFRDFDDAVISMRDDLNRDLDGVGEILADQVNPSQVLDDANDADLEQEADLREALADLDNAEPDRTWDAMVTYRSTYLHYWILCDILTDIELEEMNAS